MLLYIPSTIPHLNPSLSRAFLFASPRGIAPRNVIRPSKYSLKKIEKCPFLFFISPCPIFVLQIRSFYSTLTHPLPTGLSQYSMNHVQTIRTHFPPSSRSTKQAQSIFPQIQPYADKPIAEGAYGVFVCGSTGECTSMTVAERKSVLEAWVKAVAGRILVIAHVGGTCQADCIELARHATELGGKRHRRRRPIPISNPARSKNWWPSTNPSPPHAPRCRFTPTTFPR